ncbi:MAG: prepilin-type N-terminal cleavage/methylation domain-containing protein [Candidatus Eremiobacteraeota bacterium]|nr:prepilin-type N-terminal cleavage/methylation domain-containing protein [Candidatus Eremiobacteraeota bacterium]
MRKRRGFTLVEMLIACVLLGIMLYIVYQFFIPAIHAWFKVDAESRSQQNAIISVDRFFREISITAPASIAIYGDPYPGVSFLSFEEPEDPTAPLLAESDLLDTEQRSDPIIWKKCIIIYLDTDKNELLRKEVPYPQSSRIKRLISPSYGSIVMNPSYESKRLSTNVMNLAFSQSNYPLLNISITTSNRGLRGERTTTTNFVIFPRN